MLFILLIFLVLLLASGIYSSESRQRSTVLNVLFWIFVACFMVVTAAMIYFMLQIND